MCPLESDDFSIFPSRSATLVLAYLITRKKMTIKQAVDTVR